MAIKVDGHKSDTSNRSGDDIKGQSAYPVLVVGDRVILQNEGNERIADRASARRQLDAAPLAPGRHGL
jgi:hypothetical protein